MSTAKAAELWSFGKWMFVLTVISFAVHKGGHFFVGKLLSTSALGLFVVAYNMARAPATEITEVVSRVTFPAFSKLQGDILRLRGAYLKVLRMTAFPAFPLAAFIFVLAPDFARLFLPERWISIVPVMQLLAFLGLMGSVFSNMGPLFKAVGKPKYPFYFLLGRGIMMFAVIYPLIRHYEIVGACWAILGPAIAIKFVVVPTLLRFTGIKASEFFKALAPSAVGAVLLVITVAGVRSCFAAPIGILSFVLAALLGGVVYLAVIVLTDRKTINEIRSILLSFAR